MPAAAQASNYALSFAICFTKLSDMAATPAKSTQFIVIEAMSNNAAVNLVIKERTPAHGH